MPRFVKEKHKVMSLGSNQDPSCHKPNPRNEASQEPYLDRDREKKREGVNQEVKDELIIDPNEQGLIDYELFRVENCGKDKMLVGRNKERKIITIYCQKPYCPRCGKSNGLLHKRKYETVIARLGNLENKFLRIFVFTLPRHLTPKFKSREMLDKFTELVKRIIEKEFGVLTREKQTKKGIERIYRLRKRVVATLELIGDKGAYHPHINVLIVESNNQKNQKKISTEKLKGIKKSYKNALEKLLCEKLEVVDVHYSYRF
jgi:hypothetical protein